MIDKLDQRYAKDGGTVPTKTSELTNDSNFTTNTDVQTAISSAKTELNNTINAKIAATYKPQGSIAFSSLPTPSADVLGYVYNITDSFTSNDKFIDGGNKKYPAGTNVGIVKDGNSYKFDAMAGFIDTSSFLLSSDVVEITNAEIDALFS